MYRPSGMTRDEICDLLLSEARFDAGCLVLEGRRYGTEYPTVRHEGQLYLVSRILMERKLGRVLDPLEIVRHKCHNPPCINIDHLETGDRRDNYLDNLRSGLKAGASKLTQEEVKDIRRRFESGEDFISIALDHLHVHHDSLENVVLRRTWRDIE